MNKPKWQELMDLPRDAEGPVFAEPWQAQAFAMTLGLYERGIFTWPEWAEALSLEIAAAKKRGELDLGDTYYNHWLAALEKLLAAKQVLTPEKMASRKAAWAKAAEAAPHGEPITLARQILAVET